MYKFNSDHSFHIGHVHLNTGLPCQDYATSEVFNNSAIAVVSDGCSSGGRTDIGARIITLANITALKNRHPFEVQSPLNTIKIVENTRSLIIKNSISLLGLKKEDLLATSSFLYITKEEGIIHLQGDGVISIRYSPAKVSEGSIINYPQEGNPRFPQGGFVFFRYDWKNNTPYYPIYQPENGLEDFITTHGNDLNSPVFKEEILAVGDIKHLTPNSVRNFTLSQGIEGVYKHITKLELQTISDIALFSDGVCQFDQADWLEITKSLMSFKSTEGEFVKRRMGRVIKDSKKETKGPMDDVACAAIHIESIDNDSNQG